MTLELLVRGRAKADIRRAAKWYEQQREGLDDGRREADPEAGRATHLEDGGGSAYAHAAGAHFTELRPTVGAEGTGDRILMAAGRTIDE